MLDDIKITIKCHHCNYSNSYNQENKESLQIEKLNFFEITRIFSSLVCSQCRNKNPEIVKNDNRSLVNYPPKICSINYCENPILIPRIKALENVNTCINCASGKSLTNNFQIIDNPNYIEDRIKILKELKKRFSFINEITEFEVCKNSQIREIAKLDQFSMKKVSYILGNDSLFFKNYGVKIISILEENKVKKVLKEIDIIYF